MKKLLLLLVFAGFQSQAQVLISETFETAPTWTIAHTVGTDTHLGWARIITGANPSCTAFQGTKMMRFNSADIAAGNSYSLTSPQIAFTGGNYRIIFSMFRDSSNPTDADNLQVYYKQNTTDAGTLLGIINRSSSLLPVETEAGWHTYSFDLPQGVTGAGYVSFLGTSFYGSNIFIDAISVVQKFTNDAQLLTFDLNPTILAGNTTITGTFKNIGVNAISTIDVNWQVDGGAVQTQSLTGLNILSNQNYSYSHNIPWNAATGQHTIKVWVANTNGSDDDTTNNEITKDVMVLNEIYPKTVIYEEATGTWCGWCVRGHVGLKDMDHYHQDGSFIGIAVHNGDPMVTTAYDTAMGSHIQGYPSGIVNRAPVETDPNLAEIEAAYQAELSKIPLGKVAITSQSWNPATRQITLEVTSTFAMDMASANYNLAAIVVENNVKGTTSTWRQHNYYYTNAIDIVDWEGLNWRTLGEYIPAATMNYNHVGRALLGGWSGVANSVPSSVAYGTPYTYTFTHTLPAAQKEADIELVGILIDNTTGGIVNATEVPLNITLGVGQFGAKKGSVFPNPSTGAIHIDTMDTVDVTVFNILGKAVYTIKSVTNQTEIDLSQLQKGIYLAKISGEKINYSEKIILN